MALGKKGQVTAFGIFTFILIMIIIIAVGVPVLNSVINTTLNTSQLDPTTVFLIQLTPVVLVLGGIFSLFFYIFPSREK